MAADSYKTIEGRASAEYEEKKSRFIAQLGHVETEDEAVSFLEEIRMANPLARHNVYAYILRANNRLRYSDDGEPARTSGLPTLSVLEHEELKDVICVTTRYFGGTLLGTGGLVRAYTKAAQDALSAANVVVYAECVDITISLEYPLYDSVHHWLQEQGIEIVASNFAGEVTLEIRVLLKESQATQVTLAQLTRGQANLIIGQPQYQPMKVSCHSSSDE